MYLNYRNPHHGRTVRFGPLWSALDEKISVRRPLPSLRRTVRLNFWSASVRFGRNFKVRCPRPSLRRTALGEKTWSSVRLGPPSAFVRGRPSSSYDVWTGLFSIICWICYYIRTRNGRVLNSRKITLSASMKQDKSKSNLSIKEMIDFIENQFYMLKSQKIIPRKTV